MSFPQRRRLSHPREFRAAGNNLVGRRQGGVAQGLREKERVARNGVVFHFPLSLTIDFHNTITGINGLLDIVA